MQLRKVQKKIVYERAQAEMWKVQTISWRGLAHTAVAQQVEYAVSRGLRQKQHAESEQSSSQGHEASDAGDTTGGSGGNESAGFDKDERAVGES